MSNTAKLDSSPEDVPVSLPVTVPVIEPAMAQILELTTKSNTTVTPKEINEQLSRIRQSYDELTALFADNASRIDAELSGVRQAGGVVSGLLHQVNAELYSQSNSMTALAASTSADIASVQSALQSGLTDTEERTKAKLAEINALITLDVSRLGAGLQSLGSLLTTQEGIVAEQTARLDQFDVTYALLDTATRGNRNRIEAVRDEAGKQHTVLAAQVQGLAAMQREHYAEFEDVSKLVTVLKSEAQRLDRAIRIVAADLSSHALVTRRVFKWTHGALAALFLLTMGGFALVKWAPGFAPASTEQAVATSRADISAINEQLNVLPSLEHQASRQDGEIGQLNRAVAALKDSVGDLKRSVRGLSESAVNASASSTGSLPLFDSQWILQQNPKAFTVQISGASSQGELAAYIAQHAESLGDSTLAYTVTQPAGRERYNLFYGIFASAELARAAMEALPAAVRVNTPWVRQLGSIQAAIE